MAIGIRYGGQSGYSGYSGSGSSGYSGWSGKSGYSGIGVSGYSGWSGYSGSGTTDHALLTHRDYDSAGHTGFQKQLIWDEAYLAYLIEHL